MKRWPIVLVLVAPMIAGCPGARRDLYERGALSAWRQSPGQLATLAINNPPICENGSALVSFQRHGDAYAFGFSAAAGDVIRVESEGDSRLDTVVYLFGPLYPSSEPLAPVASDAGSGGLQRSLIPGFTVGTGGIYAVVISTEDGDGAGDASLKVSVNGQPGCTPAEVPRPSPADALADQDAAEPDGDACESCCSMDVASTVVLLRDGTEYVSLGTTEQEFSGILTRVPGGASPKTREYEFQLVGQPLTLPIYDAYQVLFKNRLATFLGCPVRVVGKLANIGSSTELWPATLSFEP